MFRIKTISVLVTLAFTAILSIDTKLTNAASFSVLEASTMIQSSVADVDAGLLSTLFGFQVGEILNFQSEYTGLGWSSSLSGMYLGENLDITYLGDTSNYVSSEMITWSSIGSYGIRSWSGNGMATISDIDSEQFSIDFNYSINVEGQPIDYTANILGIQNNASNIELSEWKYTEVNGNFTLSSPITIIIALLSQEKFPSIPGIPGILINDIKLVPDKKWISGFEFFCTENSIDCEIDGPILAMKTTPERTSNLSFLALGILGGASIMKRISSRT